MTYTLWQKFLRFDPEDPIWPNRDRFVLSIGHASMLLYSMLHLTGVKSVSKDYETLGEPSVTLDDLKKFRQLDSKCPGHPEYRWTSGVETTTGPLGQGVATSVGMASAASGSRHTTTAGLRLFDYDVYALCGDGDMMEGISSEAASLAGHLKLSNLCWIYDSNRITIDGSTSITFTEDTAARFRATTGTSWRSGTPPTPGPRLRAIQEFKITHDKPTFIVVHSHIGWGSARQDCPKAHGEPLGEDRDPGVEEEVRLLDREVLRARRRLRPLQAGIGTRARHPRRPGSPNRQVQDQVSRPRPTSSTGCSIASFPTAGTRTCRLSPPTPRAWPAESLGQDPQRDLAQRPLADRRLGRPQRARPRPRSPPRMPASSSPAIRRPELPLRHPRARDGGVRQRHGADQGPPVRCRVPHLQRLRATLDPACGDHGDPDDPHLHPRLDRRRRGRTDPPADRAARQPPGDPRPARAPARRRQRSASRPGR